MREKTMFGEDSRHRTVRAPLTQSDLQELDYDTVFLVVELSDAIRRGVAYYSLSGEPLNDLNEVLNALVLDGEVAFDDEMAEEPIAH
ncbi:MAG: hypothetical protein D6815_03310 [Candidatus Dadabacteria bacterium]|nr:MAG: hypothetical protein D6815_03310 [Candidatus Dadabacteria bacterium]